VNNNDDNNERFNSASFDANVTASKEKIQLKNVEFRICPFGTAAAHTSKSKNQLNTAQLLILYSDGSKFRLYEVPRMAAFSL
jgi:hypothetical protein